MSEKLIDAVYTGNTPVVFVGQGKKKKGDLVRVAPHEVYGETAKNAKGETIVVFEGRRDLAPVIPTDNLAKATKKQLTDLAASLGVTHEAGANKADIIEAIEAHQAGSATAPDNTEET